MYYLLSNLFILIFLSHNLLAEEYWRPPIIGMQETERVKEGELFSSWRGSFLGADHPSVFVYLSKLAVKHYNIAQNEELLENYKITLENFSESLLTKNPNVVKQGEVKKNKDFLYTFYLNDCFALIINSPSGIIMLHGQPIEHPGFKDDLKKAKKILSTYTGDTYLISHESKNLIKKFNSARDFNVIYKPQNLIGSIKALKEDANFYIKGEFHPNEGVSLTTYDKLIAYFPWGPMSPLKFEKYKQ